MDWHLPLAESTALKGIHQSLNNVDEVVMVCWNAVEAHASAGELKAAILLLSRLLASPYGTANANHELRARCRFAELCYICDILLETAVLHLNRALLLCGHNEEDTLVVLGILVKILWRLLEVKKTRTEMNALRRTIRKAFSICVASKMAMPAPTLHFGVHAINMLRMMGETVKAKAENELLRKLIDSWSHRSMFSDLAADGYFKRSLLFLALHATITSLAQGEKDASCSFSLATTLLMSAPNCDPLLERMHSYVKVALHVHASHFLKASRLCEMDDLNFAPLFEICCRFMGKPREPTVNRTAYSTFRDVFVALSFEEGVFSDCLQKLKIRDCAQSLRRFRSLLENVGVWLRDSIFKKQRETYLAMSAMMSFVCNRNSLPLQHLQTRLLGTVPLSMASLHRALTCNSLGHSGSEDETSNSNSSPARVLLELKQSLIVDQSTNKEKLEVCISSNRSTWGMLSIELWSRLQSPELVWNALELATKLGIVEVEYAAIKLILQHGATLASGPTKMTSDQLLSRLDQIQSAYWDEASKAMQDLE